MSSVDNLSLCSEATGGNLDKERKFNSYFSNINS